MTSMSDEPLTAKFLCWLSARAPVPPELIGEAAAIGATLDSLRFAARYRHHLPRRVGRALDLEAIGILAELDRRIRRFEEHAVAAGVNALAVTVLMLGNRLVTRSSFNSPPGGPTRGNSAERVRRHRDRRRRGLRHVALDLTPEQIEILQHSGVLVPMPP